MGRTFLCHVLLGMASFFSVGLPLAIAACRAPSTWFPHSSTPEPDFHKPSGNCEFHRWAWQEFLWLTQPDETGRLRLLSLPTSDMLFAPGRAPAAVATVQQQLKGQVLRLTPRFSKDEDPATASGIHQATSNGLIIDRNGRPVYYTSFVSPDYYEFVRTNKLYLKANYQAAASNLNFPKKSVQVKSSWRVIEPGESIDGLFTTKAFVPKLKCSNTSGACTGTDVEVDLTNQVEVTVALVGLHVAGVLDGHPEFIWSTFEHVNNAPELPSGMPHNSSSAVNAKDFTFYRASTSASACNQVNATSVALDVGSQKLTPTTDVFRQFAYGGGSAEDTANIISLNESVHDQLDDSSVWKNYMLVGGVWFNDGDDLTPGLGGSQMQDFTAGSINISNSTMETYTQNPVAGGRSNCFSCHSTKKIPISGLDAKNINISHILRQGLIDRENLPRMATMNLSMRELGSLQRMGFNVSSLNAIQASPLWRRTADATKLGSYANVKALLDQFVNDNNVPIAFAPHGAFWRTMTYEQFVKENIPNLTDPATGDEFKVLVVGNSAASNIIMALRGTPGTIFDSEVGRIGRMPPTGPFMSDDDIGRLADWIDSGAPE